MGLNQLSGFTDGSSSDAIQSFFNRLLLERGQYDWIHTVPFLKQPLSQRHGKTMIWRRYETLGLATTALTEGTNPSSRSKTKTDVSATLALYGDVIEDTDFLLLTQPEAVATENVELLGQQMGETMDQIARVELANATNIVYANGTSTLTVSQIIDKNDTDRAHRALKNQKAKEFTPQVMASQNIGTGPVSRAYWGLCHEDVAFDIRHLDGFLLSVEYSKSGGTIAGEFGADKNGIRFLSSPNGAYTAGATGTTVAGTDVTNDGGFVRVYNTFICGMHAIAGVDLESGNGGVIRHQAGTSGVADALNLRNTVGWKKYFVPKILNQNFLESILSAASL